MLAPYGDETPRSDGTSLGEDICQQVEAHLAVCPPCRDKASACQAARRALRMHAMNLTSSAPELLSARCRAIAMRSERPRRVRGWLGWSAVAATAAALVFLFVAPTSAVATQLALDHVKCTKLGLSTRGGTPAQLEAFWRDARAKEIAVPEAPRNLQVRLVGLRRCVTTDGNVAHLMYDHNGSTISVFAAGENSSLHEPHAAAHKTIEALGHKAVVFTSGRQTYVAVGRDPDLEAIASAMSVDLARRRGDVR